MCKLIVNDLNLPLGLVAPFKEDHPMIKKLGPETLARSSVEGTLAMLVNGGQLMDELARLSFESGRPIMGSSANLTGRGTKAFVEDIEPEIMSAADIIINYVGHPSIANARQSVSVSHPMACMLIRS